MLGGSVSPPPASSALRWWLLYVFVPLVCFLLLPSRVSAGEALRQITFRDSVVNLEFSRGEMREVAVRRSEAMGDRRYGTTVASRKPGAPLEDDSRFWNLEVAYRDGLAARARGRANSGDSSWIEVPLFEYPARPGTRSLLVSPSRGWLRDTSASSRTGRDWVRVLLEPQSDPKAKPVFAQQLVYAKVGSIELGSRAHTALLFDGNRDGRYGRDPLDGLLVDVDDDHHLEVDPSSAEFGPLRVPFTLGGESFVAVSVAPDGSQLLLRSLGSAPPTGVAQLNRSAPEFSFEDQRGREVRRADFLGRPLILFFWTSWCPRCRQEAVALTNLMGHYPEIQVLGVNLDAERSRAESFLATYASTWVNWMTERDIWEAPVARSFGVSDPGEVTLIDERGIVRAQTYDLGDVERAMGPTTLPLGTFPH